jgi:hypothetical protein
MTPTNQEDIEGLYKILLDLELQLYVAQTFNPKAKMKERSRALKRASKALTHLIANKCNEARIDELKKMLRAEYTAGTFAQPTPKLNEFLEKTPLIASYILQDRITELTKGDK